MFIDRVADLGDSRSSILRQAGYIFIRCHDRYSPLTMFPGFGVGWHRNPLSLRSDDRISTDRAAFAVSSRRAYCSLAYAPWLRIQKVLSNSRFAQEAVNAYHR